MSAAKNPLTAVLEAVTLKLDKDGDVTVTAKLCSFDPPGRLGAFSGKPLALTMAGQQVAVRAKTIAHKVDTAGEQARIKTILTTIGGEGLERLLGLQFVVSPLQGDLPGMGEDEDGAA